MMRPGWRARPGTEITILPADQSPATLTAVVEEAREDGSRRLRFGGVENIWTELDALGETPLPPYIRRSRPEAEDRERYQTVYARHPGSVAAPTAGLHFTPELLQRLRARGIETHFVTLHVGPGTFAPVKEALVASHRIHQERYVVTEETARALANVRRRGGRVVAAGTTALRALESAALENGGRIGPARGPTGLFVHPPFDFKVVDALLTNFHLPRSTLLMLVCAFAAPGLMEGRPFILKAYEEAVAQRYRFFSYGDAMLLL